MLAADPRPEDPAPTRDAPPTAADEVLLRRDVIAPPALERIETLVRQMRERYGYRPPRTGVLDCMRGGGLRAAWSSRTSWRGLLSSPRLQASTPRPARVPTRRTTLTLRRGAGWRLTRADR